MKNDGLIKAQSYLLEIAKKIDEFCKIHSIPYYIIGGTFLGAVRHRGFIPWDVDIDIALFRDDYNKLIKLLRSESSEFMVSTPGDKNHYSPHALIYSKDVEIKTSYRKKGKNVVTPLYIDIFPLDYTTNDVKKQKKQSKQQKRMKSLLYLKRGVTERKGLLATIYVFFRTLFLKLIPLKHLSLSLQKNMIKYSKGENLKLVGHMASKYDYFKVLFTDDIYGKPQRIAFGDIELSAPEKGEIYLKQFYGDFMKLPPLEKQKSSSDYIVDCYRR